ncbi:MAG: aspartate-semialdehyde dehydrogenase [Thaumarchaeota archaeon 13_1_40CM_3_38_6]|nr:MAG: aspartate-semialdehyde dehydrogenase [Thaumarchaeota archaeon 13_1_40CM_3_38_6]
MKRAAIIGVTGAVGQEFVVALNKHPWFEVKQIAASERSAKKKFVDAIRDPNSGILKWHLREPIPEYARDMIVESVDDIKTENLDLIFSSVESEAAREIETRFAKEVPVISTSSAYRYDEDVPILIPGINDDHVVLLDTQRKNRTWKGFIAPLPNCTTTGLAITMKPLLDKFGAQKIIMTSMQSMSGAGRSPGVSALDITDNIIPYIPKEEEKVRIETGKILGKLVDGKIDPAKLKVSCTCTRVPVIDGHTETVFVETAVHADPESVKKAMREFSNKVSVTGLPSAPKEYLLVHDDPTRPQPRLDREINDGMTTVVGRIREDTVFDNGIKYVLFSHNEKMGSAKGAVLLAEMLYKKGYI